MRSADLSNPHPKKRGHGLMRPAQWHYRMLRGMKCYAADPGSRSPAGSRLCTASVHAAVRPGMLCSTKKKGRRSYWTGGPVVRSGWGLGTVCSGSGDNRSRGNLPVAAGRSARPGSGTPGELEEGRNHEPGEDHAAHQGAPQRVGQRLHRVVAEVGACARNGGHGDVPFLPNFVFRCGYVHHTYSRFARTNLEHRWISIPQALRSKRIEASRSMR